MLLELSRCLYQGQSTTGALYLKKACDYIRKNLTEELRIPEIARYAGINKSYLQSLFSRQMHCTITDYINRKRLEQAAFLLINSSLTITDIAFHTGYNSRQHFAATFENIMAADLVLTGNYTENNWKQQLGKKDFLKKTASGILSHFEDYRQANVRFT